MSSQNMNKALVEDGEFIDNKYDVSIGTNFSKRGQHTLKLMLEKV